MSSTKHKASCCADVGAHAARNDHTRLVRRGVEILDLHARACQERGTSSVGVWCAGRNKSRVVTGGFEAVSPDCERAGVRRASEAGRGRRRKSQRAEPAVAAQRRGERLLLVVTSVFDSKPETMLARKVDTRDDAFRVESFDDKVGNAAPGEEEILGCCRIGAVPSSSWEDCKKGQLPQRQDTGERMTRTHSKLVNIVPPGCSARQSGSKQ
jgi:hypothetical protein